MREKKQKKDLTGPTLLEISDYRVNQEFGFVLKPEAICPNNTRHRERTRRILLRDHLRMRRRYPKALCQEIEAREKTPQLRRKTKVHLSLDANAVRLCRFFRVLWTAHTDTTILAIAAAPRNVVVMWIFILLPDSEKRFELFVVPSPLENLRSILRQKRKLNRQ